MKRRIKRGGVPVRHDSRPFLQAPAGVRYRMMVRGDRLPAVGAWLKKNGG